MRRFFLGLVLILAVVIAYGLWSWRDIPMATLEARYQLPASEYMDVDGVRMHYTDQGRGPVVLLLHAQFGSLFGWEPWVEALKNDYRVVCLDLPGHGLTGNDPERIYTPARTLELLTGFVEQAKLGRIHIGGTSAGGSAALRYAAANPERVQSLVLLSPGIIEGRERSGQGIPAPARILEYVTPRGLTASLLRRDYGDPDKVTDELIDRWHDLWRGEGHRAAMLDRMDQNDSSDLEAVTHAVRAPVLLLWGGANERADVAQADEVLELLENGNARSVMLKIYPGVGHMAVQEAGSEIAPDVRRFLDLHSKVVGRIESI